MKQDKDLPIRFAKLVVNELAGIHANVQALSDFVVHDATTKDNLPKAFLSEKFANRRDEIFNQRRSELLKILALDD